MTEKKKCRFGRHDWDDWRYTMSSQRRECLRCGKQQGTPYPDAESEFDDFIGRHIGADHFDEEKARMLLEKVVLEKRLDDKEAQKLETMMFAALRHK